MSSTDNILLRIESLMPNMQRAEQKIAAFILAHADEAKYMSVNEVSLLSQVSEASVIRFVKKLGFKGFSHFKLSLATLQAQDRREPKNEQPGDSAGALSRYIRDSLINSIQDTYSMLGRKSLESAANAIIGAKRIFCAAIGPCGVTCNLLSFYLSEVGFSVMYSPDPVMQIQNVTFSTPEDVVIAVSHSGTTTDTLKILEIARSNGTQIISITHYLQSPIIELTDILLCSYARKDPQGLFNNGTSQVAQVYVIESLYACIRLKLNGELSKWQEKIRANQAYKFGSED